MGAKKDLCRSSSGRFVRNLGWKISAAGKYVQHKFYLGCDEAKARLASLRLEQLWQQVNRRWERDGGLELSPIDRPVWDETTLAIALAICEGQSVARISLPSPFSAMLPESPLIGDWLDKLQNDISVIKVELLEKGAAKQSDLFLQKQGLRLVELGRRMLHKKAGGETLHAALDAYAHWVGAKHVDVDKKPTLWSGTQGRQIAFLREHLPANSLGGLDAAGVEGLIETIRLRPTGKRGKPVSASWAQSCLKQLRRFLRWLHRTPEFAWKWPADLEFSHARIPITVAEKASPMRSAQVETYTFEELETLWQFATPLQRLFMLLALNCGFGRAEIASLELGELVLRSKHPHEREVGCRSTVKDSWIFRVRNKSGVYGEFKLWPMTVRAVDWWLEQRARIESAADIPTLLVNGNGHRFDAPTKGNHANFQIPNAWFRLTEKIRAARPEFRRLSFNKLRKTAGNLIRGQSHGEIAAVFLCHGKPVGSDGLLDLYTNRPFSKVFEAIDQIGERLRPIWRGAASPFAEG